MITYTNDDEINFQTETKYETNILEVSYLASDRSFEIRAENSDDTVLMYLEHDDIMALFNFISEKITVSKESV